MLPKRSSLIFREEISVLRDNIFILLTRWRILLSVVAILMFINIVYAFKQETIYRATGLIMVSPAKTFKELSAIAPGEAIDPRMADRSFYLTEFAMMRSQRVADSIMARLKKEHPEKMAKARMGQVSINFITGTRIMKLGVEHNNPVLAALMADALIDAYAEEHKKYLFSMSKAKLDVLQVGQQAAPSEESPPVQVQDGSSGIIDELPSFKSDNVLQGLYNDKRNLEMTLTDLGRRYKDKHPSIIELREKLRYLDSRIDYEKSRIGGIINLGLSGGADVTDIIVLERPKIPTKPVKPNRPQIILVGLAASLIAGFAVVLVMDCLDDSIKGQEDVEVKLALPYLGGVPVVKKLEAVSGEHVVPPDFDDIDSDTETADSIRDVKINITFSMPTESMKTMMITSTIPGEGKTFVSSYLAYVFSKAGLKTLLIDMDMRRPKVHKMFGIKTTEPGLTNMVVENAPMEKVVRSTAYKDLFVMTPGSKTPNPQEFIGSEKLQAVLKGLSGKFDKVLIDTPPGYSFVDFALLAKVSDANLLVCKFGGANKDAILKVKRKIGEAGSKFAGVIINFNKPYRSSYYAYRYYTKYHKGYYSPEEKKVSGV